MAFVLPALALLSTFVVPLLSEGAKRIDDAASSTALAGEPSKIGDLSKYRTIVIDVKSLVDKGDLDRAKARVKDLETAWDESEAGLKPRAGKDWRRLDKAIDVALDALRESKPKQVDCKKSVEAVIGTIDELSSGK